MHYTHHASELSGGKDVYTTRNVQVKCRGGKDACTTHTVQVKCRGVRTRALLALCK